MTSSLFSFSSSSRRQSPEAFVFEGRRNDRHSALLLSLLDEDRPDICGTATATATGRGTAALKGS